MRKYTQMAMFLPIATMALFACKTVVKSKTADYDVMYITKNGIIQKPMVTDLEVASKKMSISRTYQNVTLANAKENALGDFIKEYNCDLIVQPYFSTSTTIVNEKADITVNLSGYPASFKNIKNFEPKDTASFIPSKFRTSASLTPTSNNNNTVGEKKPVEHAKKADNNSGSDLWGAVWLASLIK